MEEIILNAEKRNKIKNFKEEGFVPGVLYGDEIDGSIPVKLDCSSLQKILNRYGAHVKLWVMYDKDKKFGFIKDIQKHPVTHQIRHMDIQIVSQDEDVKMQIPIVFEGEESLKKKHLHLQVHKDVIDVYGKATQMPDSVHVDASEKEQGDMITTKDFTFDNSIKITNEDDDVFGVIGHQKVETIETPTGEEENEMPIETETKADAEE